MSLFDPADYPSPQDAEPRKKRRKNKPKPIILSDGHWFVITTTDGVMDYCHRVQPSRGELGSVLTRCDRPGRTLEAVPAGAAIHPCPRCISQE